MGFLGPLLDQKFNSDPIHPADLGPAARESTPKWSAGEGTYAGSKWEN
jgi:hypothetical protein